MKQLLIILMSLWVGWGVSAQDSTHVRFSYAHKRVNNQVVEFTITAHVLQSDTRLYPLQQKPEDAVYSQVVFDSSVFSFLNGAIVEKGTIETEYDAILSVDVRCVKDSVQWVQQLSIPASETAVVKGQINYMYKSGDTFSSAEAVFREIIEPNAGDGPTIGVAPADTEGANPRDNSLWWIFLASFGGGLIALITPCVYSMIPVTVSFFTKRSNTKAKGIQNAIAYSLSIIIIFTLLGFVITLIFGPDALNKLATHWLANLIFFLIFLVFGISFLGAFDIELPAKWSTAADSNANTKSFKGIFFMALTLVIVSFSCTGPIIGNLLVLASQGSRLGPLVGMFGFSLALALPFALFAFFPSKLNALGKAGGWLNSVKVTLGFLELALALKFLSNADLTQGWRILDREIFLVLWIAIFLLLSLYLLGKLKFKHDDELPKNDFGLPYLSITRLFFAIVSLSFTIYLVPGLWGAPLHGVSAFLPPMGTQDFNADDIPSGHSLNSVPYVSGAADAESGVLPRPKKFAEVMKNNEPAVVVNNGLVTYFDYEEALEVARKVKKPLMLDFTGVNCVNCRKMEGQVWSHPEVMRRLKEHFVIASLYMDVHGKGVVLPVEEQYYSKHLGKHVETLGEKNTDLQISRFGSNAQPIYFFLDQNESPLAPQGYGYDASVEKFINHLDKVVEEYRNRQEE